MTSDAAVDFNPVWSPDGKYLLFSSDRGGSPNLWRVPIDEATGKGPGSAGGCDDELGAGSPDVTVSGDGHRVAYASMTTYFEHPAIRLRSRPPARFASPGQWVTTGSAFRKDPGRLAGRSAARVQPRASCRKISLRERRGRLDTCGS